MYTRCLIQSSFLFFAKTQNIQVNLNHFLWCYYVARNWIFVYVHINNDNLNSLMIISKQIALIFKVNYITWCTHHFLSFPYTKVINNISCLILKNIVIFACFCNVLQCKHVQKPSINYNIFCMKYCYFITSCNFFNMSGPKRQKLSTFKLHAVTESQNHRITESQNGRGWKGPLWVI